MQSSRLTTSKPACASLKDNPAHGVWGVGILRAGLQDEGDAGVNSAYAMQFSAPTRGNGETNKGFDISAIREEQLKKLGSNGREFDRHHGQDYQRLSIRPRFSPDDVSPIWPVNFRRSVVRDMAAIPLTKTQWRRLRLEVDAQGRACLWCNGFVVADYQKPMEVAGRVSLRLFGPMRVASLRVYHAERKDQRFIPIALDDLLNATGPVDRATLPKAGQVTAIDGIPFEIPTANEQGDHIDVGRSVFRYRMKEGFRDQKTPNATPAPSCSTPPAFVCVCPGSR